MKEPIDNRQLRAFVTLVNTGSFTQTAKQLFLSQSAISHSIKELVKLGLGISAMAPWTVRGELRQKTLVTLPLGKRKLRRNWGILRRRGKRPTLAEETFVTLSRSICTSFAEPA